VRPGVQKAALVVGVVVLAAGAGAAGLMVARTGNARGYPVSDLPEGVSAATLQVTPAFLYRHGSNVLALRPFAPDSPVPVAWCPAQRFFEDPSTGSKFRPNGDYLAGPADRGLDRISSTVVGGVLQIAPGRVEPGRKRGLAIVLATSLPPCDWRHAVFAPGVAAPPSPTAEPGS
jgi:hypothetical protein